MRPEQRASENQRDSVRAEGHAQWDRIMDAWSEIDRQSREMGRGYPSGGEGGGADGGSLTERVAVGVCRCEAGRIDPSKCACPSSTPFDPATAASDWLTHLQETRGHLKNLDGSLKRILPVDATTVERGRVNQVDLCTECDLPAPKVKRLDGKPYHHPDSGESCWWTAYNRSRGRRGA